MPKKTNGSWVQSANIEGSDFPIENLPYGCFRILDDSSNKSMIGVAIGDQILPLTGLAEKISIPTHLKEAFLAFDASLLKSIVFLL